MSRIDDFAFGLYEKALPDSLSWPERLEQAAGAGYSFMEFSVDDSDERQARLDWSAAQKREFRMQVEVSGLYVPTLALSGNHRYPIGCTDPEIRHRGMELLEKSVNLASELGIRVVQVAGYDELDNRCPSEESAANFTENLEKAVVLASKRGVVLAIENMGVPFMDSISKVMSFVSRFNTPYLQAYADIGNSTAMNQDVSADIASAGGHLAAVHIKDTMPGVLRHIPFGEGIVDFDLCFRTIRETGYTGMFIVEMWANGRDDTFDEVKSAREFVLAGMKRVWPE